MDKTSTAPQFQQHDTAFKYDYIIKYEDDKLYEEKEKHRFYYGGKITLELLTLP